MSDDVVSTGASDWPPIRPWHLLVFAATVVGLSWLLSFSSLTWLSVLCLLAGLVAAGGAVAQRPRSPGLLGLAAIIALVAAWTMNPAWDSARLVVVVLAGVALFAAFMIYLPTLLGRVLAARAGSDKEADRLRERGQWLGQVVSRAVVSVLVVVHFAGIICAVLSAPLPGRESSWLAQSGWSALQPYLQFAYLTNAYHFYSPEPGPPSLLWYYVEYADGSTRELRIPDKNENKFDPLGQEYTRRLSLAEGVNQIEPLGAIPDDVLQARLVIANEIPLHPDMPREMQYRLPSNYSKRLLGEFARYAGQHFRSEKDPSLPVKSVRIYRVVHRILEPREMGNPYEAPDPAGEWTYMPYYQGEFVPPPAEPNNPDPDRPWVLSDSNDPLLYWLVPIYRRQVTGRDELASQGMATTGARLVTVNWLQEHAHKKTKAGEQRP